MESNGSSWLSAILTFFGGATVYQLLRSIFNRLAVPSDVVQKRRLTELEKGQIKLERAQTKMAEDMRRDGKVIVELVTDVRWMKGQMTEAALRNCGPSKPGQ